MRGARASSLRASWHAYQLIGDVLRSEDLACDVRGPRQRSSTTFRARMANEPVVLGAAGRSRRLSVETPARVANGMCRPWQRARLAARRRNAGGGRRDRCGRHVRRLASPRGAPADRFDRRGLGHDRPCRHVDESLTRRRPFVASDQLIRDARLDRYLAAHKQFAGSTALGIPSGFLRNATAIESDR